MSNTICPIDSASLESTIKLALGKLLIKNRNNVNSFKKDLILLLKDFNYDKTTLINVTYDFLSNVHGFNVLGEVLNKFDLEILLNQKPNKNKKSLDIEDKTSKIDKGNVDPLKDKSDLFINNTYGTSTVKDKLLNNFKVKLPRLLFFNKDNTEITNLEAINDNIINYLRNLLQEVLDYCKKDLDPNKKYTLDNIEELSEDLKSYKQYYNPRDLLNLNNSSLNSDRKLLKMLNNLFILNHFDSILQLVLNELIAITKDFNMLSEDSDYKYFLNLHNIHIALGWGVADEDINALEETSDIVNLLLSDLPVLDINGKEIPDTYLSLQLIGNVNIKIRGLVNDLKSNVLINDVVNIKSLENIKSKVTTSMTLKDLICNSFEDGVEGIRTLYTVLANDKFDYFKFGLTKEDINTIKSIYNKVFNPKNPESLYSVYLNTLQKEDSVNYQNNYYYTYVTSFLNTQEKLNSQQYLEEDGIIKNQTLEATNENVYTRNIDNILSGKFSILMDNKFNTFNIDDSNITLDKIEKKLANNDSKFTPEIRINIANNDNKNIYILKNGKNSGNNVSIFIDNKLVTLDDNTFKQFIPFLEEVIGFKFSPNYLKILSSLEALYKTLLINMASNILYNYTVSKNLYLKKYTNFNLTNWSLLALEVLFNNDPKNNKKQIPRFNKSSRLLVYTNNLDAPIKKNLVRAQNILNNVTVGHINKDASGKAISSIGLDLLVTKVSTQFRRSNIKNPALKNFSLNNVYTGLEFARDAKVNGEVKSATKYSEAENFVSTFMYDYLDNIVGLESSGKVKIMPSVISDKSRIMKTILDLNAMYIEEGKKPIAFKDMSVELILHVITKELGDYYESIYKDSVNLFNLIKETFSEVTDLLNIVGLNPKTLIFDYKTNFITFNDLVKNALIKFSSNPLNNKYPFYIKNIEDKDSVNSAVDTFIKTLLHATQIVNPNIRLTNIIHYTVKNGIHGNALLFELLHRWGKLQELASSKDSTYTLNFEDTFKSYGLETGYKSAEDFFKIKKLLYLSDILYKNCEIKTQNSLFEDYKNPSYKHLSKIGWATSSNIIFAKLKYKNVYDEKEKTLNITSKEDLKNSYLYKKINNNNYNYNIFKIYQAQHKEITYKEFINSINVDSPTFDLNVFKDAVVIFNTLETPRNKTLNSLRIEFYKKLADNETLGDDFKENNKEAIKTFVDAFITEDNLDNLYSNNSILNSDLDPALFSIFNNTLNSILTDEFKEKHSIEHSTIDFSVTLEMNPELEKYLALDYLFSSEYMNATVGTHINHPAKFGNTLIEKESAVWGQQVKRNVSLTASKHYFNLNLLDGIRKFYNIAVIEDDKDFVCNVFGETSKVAPYDGSTFCAITTNYLENNSLKGDAVGIDKKQFIHDYNANSGTGIIIKTAGFALTNGHMRDSIFLQRMNKKLLNIKFKDVKGNEYLPDLNIDSITGKNNLFKRFGDIIYRGTEAEAGISNNENARVIIKNTGIEYKSGNTIIHRLYLKDGKWIKLEDKTVKLDNNYTIWKELFGGAYSIDLISEKTGEFKYSENSCKQLAYAMNHVGIPTGKGKITSQRDIDLVLKRSVIDYVVTEGAIKLGATNINSKKAYFDDDYELTTMTLNMYDAGIQLDAEHESDESVLSLMTLVLNALGAKGYTADPANATYKALRILTEEVLYDFVLGIKDLNVGDARRLLKFLTNIVLNVVNNISTTDGNLMQALANEIRTAYGNGDQVTYDLIRRTFPLSIPGTFNNMVSLLASYLTKKCIRIKFPGSMDVLSPSNKIYKLYDNKLLSSYDGLIATVQNLKNKPLSNIHLIELGRTYTIYGYNPITLLETKPSGDDVLIDDPGDYWKVKDAWKLGLISNIEENLKAGRDLASYNVRFKADTLIDVEDLQINLMYKVIYKDKPAKNLMFADLKDVKKELKHGAKFYKEISYNMWDLVSIKNLYIAESKVKKLIKSLDTAENKLPILTEIAKIYSNAGYKKSIYQSIQENSYDDLESLESELIGIKSFHSYLLNTLLNTLENLSENSVVTLDNGTQVKIKSKEIKPYELIMSKLYETTFGLKEGDDVQSIADDKLFFVKRFIENYSELVTPNCYSLELKTVNGDNLYFLDSEAKIDSKLLKEKHIDILYIDGEVVQVLGGKIIRTLSSDLDKIYVDNNGNEIIMTANVDFYLNNTLFMNINISNSNTTKTLANILLSISKVKKKSALNLLKNLSKNINNKSIIEHINSLKSNQFKLDPDLLKILDIINYGYELFKLDLKSLKNDLNSGKSLNIDSYSTAIKNIIESGYEIHTSFLKSLKVLAARIPAQSHLSFMAMKVVGFDNSGKNTAFVNRMLLWLQGSDYDIDKVSLLGYKFRNGKLVTWSPLMSLSSAKALEASEKLPFPTGNALDVSKTKEDVNYNDLVLELIANSLEEGSISNNVYDINFKGHSEKFIETFIEILNLVDSLGYIPKNDNSWIADLINKHNTFLNNGDKKGALINFISTNMYNISANPINLILGQTPIDTPTDAVKELAKPMPMGIRAKYFNPGSPMSKLELLILTLTGKENTGIVASAMKNFEACSLYYYKVLKLGNPELQKHLLINKKIFDKNIMLLANAYTSDENTIKVDKVKQALAEVNNDLDAFILFSALLSLSTDNAKDPTLAKINASPKFMSLYTAGIMMGFDMETLIDVIASPVGWAMNDLLTGNIFNDDLGIYNIDGVFKYLSLGPITEFKLLPIQLLTILTKKVEWYLANKNILTEQKKLKVEEIVKYICRPDFPLFFKENKVEFDYLKEYTTFVSNKLIQINNALERLNKKEKLSKKDLKTKDIYELQLATYTRLSENKAIAEDKAELDRIHDILIERQNTEVLDVNEIIGNLGLSDSEQHLTSKRWKPVFNNFVKAVYKYKNFKDIVYNLDSANLFRPALDENKNKIITENGKIKYARYRIIDIIKELNYIANELSRLRPILKLNQELPNSLTEQIKFLRNFENIFKNRLKEIKVSKDVEQFIATILGESMKVDFNKFVTDESYRENVIEAYDKIKMAVNIFDVMANSEHYFGYMKAANTLFEMQKMESRLYTIIDHISKDILDAVITPGSKLYPGLIKSITKFVTFKINNQFLLSREAVIEIEKGTIYNDSNKEIEAKKTAIVLGTPSGNASFKRWMEETVIPELKETFKYNKFIKDLIPISDSRTFNGEAVINYTINTNLMPKSDQERAEFKSYKDSLNDLQKCKYANMAVSDLFFYYNLITYNGESTQNSFTGLFEDIFAEKSSDLVSEYIKFFSIFDKEKALVSDIQNPNDYDYTKDELLRFIAPITTPENGSKLDYIRIYNPDRMEIELAKFNPNTDTDIDPNDPNIPSEVTLEEQNDDNSDKESAGITIYKRLHANNYNLVLDELNTQNPKYFVNNFIDAEKRLSLSGDISIINDKINIGNKLYTLEQLAEISEGKYTAKNIIVKHTRGPLKGKIDNKKTLENIKNIIKVPLNESIYLLGDTYFINDTQYLELDLIAIAKKNGHSVKAGLIKAYVMIKGEDGKIKYELDLDKTLNNINYLLLKKVC